MTVTTRTQTATIAILDPVDDATTVSREQILTGPGVTLDDVDALMPGAELYDVIDAGHDLELWVELQDLGTHQLANPAASLLAGRTISGPGVAMAGDGRGLTSDLLARIRLVVVLTRIDV